ncbi:MAG: VCBS repeat-containing protein, partial [Myxococcaceae bacterium]
GGASTPPSARGRPAPRVFLRPRPPPPRGTSRLFCVLASFVLFSAQAALAAATPESALERLSNKVAQEVRRSRPPSPIAIQARGASPELSRAFVTLLSAALTRGQHSVLPLDAPSFEAAENAAREEGARSLLRLTLSVDQGQLRARGDLLGTHVNFWSGKSATRPAVPAAAIALSTEVDALVTALGSVPVAPTEGSLKLQTFARLPTRTAALAAGDLDEDGKDEIAVLTDDELIVFSSQGTVLARRSHAALPRAAAVSREPFGAIVLSPSKIAYLSGQRAKGEALKLERGSFAAATPIGELPPYGQLVPGQNTFNAAPRVVVPFSTLSFSPSGQELVVFPDGGARWSRPGAGVTLTGLGTASALFERDGRVELATTSSAFAPEPDTLKILSAVDAPPRWERPLPEGRALQLVAADLDGDHRQELVVGIWLPDGSTELQVAR